VNRMEKIEEVLDRNCVYNGVCKSDEDENKLRHDLAMKLSQLFPQPLTDEALREKIACLTCSVNFACGYKFGEVGSACKKQGILADEILTPLQHKTREEIDALRNKITELNKKLDDREADLLEAQTQERKEVGEWLLNEYEATPQDKRIALFETVIEKLIAGQALKGDKEDKNG